MPRSILSGRCTRRCFGTALSTAAATHLPDHAGDTGYKHTGSSMAEMLFCTVARHLQTGGTLSSSSASSGSSVTTRGCCSLLLVMAACAQGHLNLIPALLSLPMVEHHFIPRTYHQFGRIREGTLCQDNIANIGQGGNAHTSSHNE